MKEIAEIFSGLAKKRSIVYQHSLCVKFRGQEYAMAIANYCREAYEQEKKREYCLAGLAELASGFRKASASQVISCLKAVVEKLSQIRNKNNFSKLCQKEGSNEAHTMGWLTFIVSAYIRENLWDLEEVSAEKEISLCLALIEALPLNPLRYEGLRPMSVHF